MSVPVHVMELMIVLLLQGSFGTANCPLSKAAEVNLGRMMARDGRLSIENGRSILMFRDMVNGKLVKTDLYPQRCSGEIQLAP